MENRVFLGGVGDGMCSLQRIWKYFGFG